MPSPDQPPRPEGLAIPAPPAALLRVAMLPALRARLLRALALVPALLFILCALSPPLNHDVAAVLNFAERWRDGEQLYTQLIDVNPPLIFILNLLPAAIAGVLPLDAVQALLWCLLALVGLSAWLCARLRRGAGEGVVEAAVLGFAVPLLLLAAGYDFGQREHIMVICAMPYLLLAGQRADGKAVGRGLRIGIALLAALGFALKPHFLAIPALVEAVVLWHRGPRRAVRDVVPWVMAAAWLLYLASIPVFFPRYFAHVVPLVWDNYVGLGNFTWWQVLLTERLGSVLLLLVPIALLLLRPGTAALPRVVLMAALGATIAAAVQHKGWSYHILPVRLFAGLLIAVLVARWADRALVTHIARRSAPAFAAAACWLLAVHNIAGAEAPWRQITFSWSREGAVAALLKREAYGERLLVLSPDVYPVYPSLNYAEAQSTLRTMTLWLLQGVYAECPANGARYRETWEMSRTEFFVYRTVAEDFARAPPAALFVARNAGIPRCGRDFDFLEYFSRHPLFAETFRRYRLAAEVEGYRLYRRED